MIFVISEQDIIRQLFLQLERLFLVTEEERNAVKERVKYAFEACEENFSYSPNKYFHVMEAGVESVRFDPYHSVQYMIFLYYLSNDLYKNRNVGKICDKIYYLNKMMNAVDLFYAVDLPEHFGAEHPIGSVLGRAVYGDNFYFYQNCTVGGTMKDGVEVYPTIGECVQLCSNSAILGDCHIGDHVIIGSGTIVKNQDIPDQSLVFGSSPNLIIKKNIHKSLVI